MNLLGNTKVVASRDQVSCKLGVEAAILNLKNGTYYGLDPVGARVWDLVQEPRTVSDLRELLIAEYDVDPVRLESDIRDLLRQLADNQLLEISA
jgi:hypothetical protein